MAEDEIDCEAGVRLAKSHPTKIYVNLLIMQMYESGQELCLLKQSEPLPVAAYDDHEESPQPFPKVVNCLKVMAGFDPVIFPQPREGHVELMIKGADYVLHVLFDDRAPDRSVALRLKEGTSPAV